jgi:moderate conductance mechanosensitive channel
MRVLIRQARRFHVVIRLTVLSLLTGILVITWAPHASGQIPDLSIPRAPSNQLPNEVTRYGSIEVAAVQSPIDNADLFEVAAPTIYDRSRPNTTPVEEGS